MHRLFHRRGVQILLLSTLVAITGFFGTGYLKLIFSRASSVLFPAKGIATVEDRLFQYGNVVDARLAPIFRARKITYPPQRLVFVGLKQEKRLEVYAADEGNQFRFICAYPILAASGHLGPKREEGDMQVPEGIYQIQSLNPNSLYHLSLRISYPNDLDRRQAALEHRARLGGDIMIHGNSCSIGCLAMGDPASEDLFVLAAKTGIKNITVMLSPVDFRKNGLPASKSHPSEWVTQLYREIAEELRKYRNDD